jgi:hypothetical protein
VTAAKGNPEPEPRSQHNIGSGTFVAGNVQGSIHNHYEQLSKETKEHLKIIAKTSPGLAGLLTAAAVRSTRDADTAELIAVAARRFNLADSAELLANAAATFQRIALPDTAVLLSDTAHKLEKVLPRLLAAAETLDSNRRGRGGWT